MLPADGTRPKDFAMVKKDGVYHLFYIRHNDFFVRRKRFLAVRRLMTQNPRRDIAQ